MSYEEKAVAFIDLLGFKEKNVDQNSKSEIHDVLTTNNQFVEIINQLNYKSKCEIRIFSDSVYFSYPKKNIYQLILDLK